MRPDDYLVLHYDELSSRAESFYERMGSSESFRALFLNDPVGTAASVLFPDRPTPPAGQVNRANRLLFSLLGNAGFREWAKGFGERLLADATDAGGDEEPLQVLAARFDRSRAYRELVDAVLEHGDEEIVSALLAGAGEQAAYRPLPGEDLPVITVALPITYNFTFVFPLVYIGTNVEAFSRVDLERVSSFLSEELPARAQQLRDSGRLG